MNINKFFISLLRLKKVILKKDFYSKISKKIKDKTTLGNKGAQWTVCSEHINKNSIIYSFGVGTDISFDKEMIEKFGVNIEAFDPTPKSIQWIREQNLPKGFNFHPIGIAAINGKIEFTLPDNSDYISGSINNLLGSKGEKIQVPVKDLSSLMNDLNHNYIDILKMDIEGSEYEVIDNILSNGIQINQILIEFYHRFPKIGINKSKQAIRNLKKAGYEIFHISNNGEEYSFIKI